METDGLSPVNLFTYGTLMDAAVWTRIAGERGVTRRAVLHGYEARCLRGVPWPGLVECEDGLTHGLLYLDVSAAALARLDEYEGDAYVRITATVILEDNSPTTAAVYLIHPDRRDAVLPAVWLPPSHGCAAITLAGISTA